MKSIPLSPTHTRSAIALLSADFAFVVALCACSSNTSAGPGTLDAAIESGMVTTDRVIQTDTPRAEGGAIACTAPSGACNVYSGEGCTGAESCYFASLPSDGGTPQARAMCIATGTVAVGAACSFVNECQAQATCFNNVCRRVCCQGSTECGAGSTCIGLRDVASNSLGVCVASASCNAVDGSGCTAGTGKCYFQNAASGQTGCFAEGSAATDGVCDALNGCQPGHLCASVGGATSLTCIKLCPTASIGSDAGASECGVGKRCVAAPTVMGAGVCLN